MWRIVRYSARSQYSSRTAAGPIRAARRGASCGRSWCKGSGHADIAGTDVGDGGCCLCGVGFAVGGVSNAVLVSEEGGCAGSSDGVDSGGGCASAAAAGASAAGFGSAEAGAALAAPGSVFAAASSAKSAEAARIGGGIAGAWDTDGG